MYHSSFRDLRDHLREGDLVIVNDSKVFPARLLGNKPSGGKVDMLLLEPCHADGAPSSWLVVEDPGTREWNCLIRSSRRPKRGQAFAFPHGLEGEVTSDSDGGVWKVRFNLGQSQMLAYLENHGLVPLPPYIKRNRTGSLSEDSAEDRKRYQTVFAEKVGSVAAPTAGLHFTEPLCRSLEESGIAFGRITLHVGQATFLPIRARDIRRHRMWPERYSVSEDTAEKIRKTKGEGRRLIAVGTTVVRCLESLVSDRGGIEAGERWANLYIVPGHRFEVVDAMITNFHLPGTSLLVLVCAFAQRQHVLKAYREAIRREYRFFSYGDCMLVQ
jgi:S-adenosylmethionine:tRNA ribosyltransferase-isomerase